MVHTGVSYVHIVIWWMTCLGSSVGRHRACARTVQWKSPQLHHYGSGCIPNVSMCHCVGCKYKVGDFFLVSLIQSPFQTTLTLIFVPSNKYMYSCTSTIAWYFRTI